MYTKFFGLQKKPFILTPDPEFLYLSRVHDLAITHLEYGLVQNAGFLALTGEVGAGKTTLLKYLFDRVKDSLDIAMIFNTNLPPQALLEMLVKEFEVDCPSNGRSDIYDALFKHFLDQYSRHSRCVIVVDEAQNLPNETFEELRMLSNLEVDDDFLIQIVLVGQPELRERLAHPSLTQLTQRISVYFHLSPLHPTEVKTYIAHRLKIAGYSGGEPLFTDEALAFLEEVSQGIPRVINSLCDACLLYAFADEIPQVSRDLVEKVVSDNQLLFARHQGDSPENGKKFSVEASAHPAPLQDSSELKATLARVSQRLESMEMRLNALEAGRHDKASEILQDMLAKERERSHSMEQKAFSLLQKYKKLQAEFEKFKAISEMRQEKKNEKFWRSLFSERH